MRRRAVRSRRTRLKATDRHDHAWPDAAMVGELYDAYGASCYRLARRMVSQDQASAIVRDVYLAVWTGKVVLDPAEGSAQTSLLVATHRRAVAALRRQRQQRGAAGPRVVAVLPTSGTAQRQVLELAYFGGHTQPEIATLTGTALTTIKTLTLEALHQLRSSKTRSATT
jgi:DNA-directed RNA polymerase specialized sigma24 family protein